VSVEERFRVIAEVAEVLNPGLFRVRLGNGHRLIGHVSRRDQPSLRELKTGDRVWVELSPYDLSKGRVRQKVEASNESTGVREKAL
jgi:translation initiation factor IF-1